MKKIVFASIFICFLFSCVNNSAKNQNALVDTLKATLNTYLNQNPSSIKYHINYNVKNLSFFKESDIYLCEINVHMKSDAPINGKLLDTEGVMKFRINKDFKILSRDY